MATMDLMIEELHNEGTTPYDIMMILRESFTNYTLLRSRIYTITQGA